MNTLVEISIETYDCDVDVNDSTISMNSEQHDNTP